jgi:hypothetical protein
VSLFDIFLFACEENSPYDPLFVNSPFLAEKSSEYVPMPFLHFGFNSLLDCLTLEDGTDELSRNVGK